MTMLYNKISLFYTLCAFHNEILVLDNDIFLNNTLD